MGTDETFAGLSYLREAGRYTLTKDPKRFKGFGQNNWYNFSSVPGFPVPGFPSKCEDTARTGIPKQMSITGMVIMVLGVRTLMTGDGRRTGARLRTRTVPQVARSNRLTPSLNREGLSEIL